MRCEAVGRRLVCALALLFLATPWVRAASLEAYGRLPSLEDMTLSPDGSHIAFVSTDGEQRYVFIRSSDLKGKPFIMKFGDIKLRAIIWADEDHLMIESSVAGRPTFMTGPIQEWSLLNVVDLKTKKIRSIPNLGLGPNSRTMSIIESAPLVRTINGHTVIFVTGMHFTGGQGVPALIRADLSSPNDTLVQDGSFATRRWWVDDGGRVAAEEDYYDKSGRWTISGNTTGALRLLAEGHAGLDYPDLLGYGPSSDSLMVSSLEDGKLTLRLLRLSDGKLETPVARDGLDGVILDRDSLRTVGLHFVDSEMPYLFFDPKWQQSWDAIQKAFPGEYPRLQSESDDFSKVIVRVQGQQHGYSYQLVDLKQRRAVPLGPVYDGVTTLYPKRSIHYSAADGLDIQAWLTLPSDHPGKPLALIVMPHGGPAARDGFEFDWWSQALAAQGYAVLQPNYRGSNTTWALQSAGFGEFGRKMQTDLSDGVAYLAKQGIIDRSRVCIVGGSYGGYAALAAATLQPDLYRCAVSVSGIADLRRQLRGVEAGSRSETTEAERYWDRYIGGKGIEDPALDAISPIMHVDAVKIPILLVHGKDDSVVRIEQSRLMLKALQGAHKDAQLIELDGEDHWLSRSKTRLQMLQATSAFLMAHNPPDASSAVTAPAAKGH